MFLERFRNKNVQLLSSLQILFLLNYVNFAIVTYTLVVQSEICLFCPHPCLLRCEIEKFFLEHDGIFAKKIKLIIIWCPMKGFFFSRPHFVHHAFFYPFSFVSILVFPHTAALEAAISFKTLA